MSGDPNAFRGFVITVLQISMFSVCWVFLDRMAIWFKAKVISKGGEISGMPGVAQATATANGSTTQSAPRPGFFHGAPAAAGAPAGQRDFAEFR
jgi:hypothetical protein